MVRNTFIWNIFVTNTTSQLNKMKSGRMIFIILNLLWFATKTEGIIKLNYVIGLMNLAVAAKWKAYFTFFPLLEKENRRSINLKKPRIYWKIYIILAGYSNMCKFIFNHLQAYHVYIIYKIYVLIFDLYITMTLHGYRVAYHDDFFLIICYILLLSWHSLLWEPFFLYICLLDNKKIGSHLKLRQGRVKNIPSNKKQRGFAWHVTLHKW